MSIQESAKIFILFIVRSISITVLTIFFAIGFILTGEKAARAKILKWYLESCGSAFIKLGQVLAMRYDLLDETYCRVLASLLDNVSAVPFKTIKSIVEKEFGHDISVYFLEINPIPIGSASIAQVHEAKLYNGEAVVLKVIKPGYKDKFYTDLTYLKIIARIVSHLGLLKKINIKQLIRELIELTWEEFDFRREARNIEKMHKQLLMDEVAHYAPKTYPSMCSLSIITMEKVNGVSVKSMIKALEEKDSYKLSEWAKIGITPKRTSRILLRSILEQCIRHRYFHADPHAANLIVMKGGTLAWVDFGMVGWLDEALWVLQFRLRIAISKGNIHEAYTSLLATLEPVPSIDLSLFEAEVKGYIRDWIFASESSNATVLEKSSGYFFLKIFSSVRRAGLSMPPGLARMYRTIIIGDMTMIKLDPGIDWIPILKDFINDEQRRQMKTILYNGFEIENLSATLQFFSTLPRASLGFSNWIQNRLPEYGKSYRQLLSRLERISLMILEYLRTLIYLFAIVVIIRKLFTIKWFNNWSKFNTFIDNNWSIILILTLISVLFLNKVIYEFKRSDY